MNSNFHEDLSRSVAFRNSSDRSLGFALTLFSSAAGLWPLVHHRVRVLPLLLAAAFLLVTLLRPALLHPLNKACTACGLLLGKITNPIVTTLLFFVVFTPIGWISRIRGRDLLRTHAAPQVDSYWILRTPPGPGADTMSKQF